MSVEIPIDRVANQSLSVQLDNNRYDIVIRDIGSAMAIDLSINEESVISGQILVSGSPVIPYEYLEVGGNFVFNTELYDIPYWESFGVNQELVYVTEQELKEIRGD